MVFKKFKEEINTKSDSQILLKQKEEKNMLNIYAYRTHPKL